MVNAVFDVCGKCPHYPRPLIFCFIGSCSVLRDMSWTVIAQKGSQVQRGSFFCSFCLCVQCHTRHVKPLWSLPLLLVTEWTFNSAGCYLSVKLDLQT